MTFKFGDIAEVITPDSFYKGVVGTVVYFNRSDNTYTLQLAHGITKEFYASALTKAKKKRPK